MTCRRQIRGRCHRPELNGRTGVIEGFDDDKGRYAVSVRVEGRKKPAALWLQTCLAAVPGSGGLREQQLLKKLLPVQNV